MSKGKKEKKHRKASLTDEQKKEVKAYLRSIRSGYKAGLPVTVTVGASKVSPVVEAEGDEGAEDEEEYEEKSPKGKKHKKVAVEDTDSDSSDDSSDSEDEDEDEDDK